MKVPTAPCGKHCPDRAPGCHGESCPHGWVEYERARREYYKARKRGPRYTANAEKLMRKRGDGID